MNNGVKIEVNNIGAELSSIKYNGFERLHQPNENTWNHQSPIMFPTCGPSADNKIIVNGKEYPQGQHGFIRDKEFILEKESKSYKDYIYESCKESKKYYPFDFKMRVSYTTSESQLFCRYNVFNTSDTDMFFNIGGHPGFKLQEGTDIEDYSLQFEKDESNCIMSRIVEGDLFENGKTIPLSKEFSDNSIFLGNLISKRVFLFYKDKKIMAMKFSTPYFGIWTRYDKNDQFICLEPWDGISNKEYRGDISKRTGIIRLKPHGIYSMHFILTFY